MGSRPTASIVLEGNDIKKLTPIIFDNFSCAMCNGLAEMYVVKDSVWKIIPREHWDDVVCLKCLKAELGRDLTLDDVKHLPASLDTFCYYFKLDSPAILTPRFVKDKFFQKTMKFSDRNMYEFLVQTVEYHNKSSLVASVGISKNNIELQNQLFQGNKCLFLRCGNISEMIFLEDNIQKDEFVLYYTQPYKCKLWYKIVKCILTPAKDNL